MFAIQNMSNINLVDSARLSINDFTRKNPLTALVGIVALSYIASVAFTAATFSGLILGVVFTFTVLTSVYHMGAHREDFALLFKASFRSLFKTNSFDERQVIEQQAKAIRDKIAARNV